jgi:hypothetical protein
LEERQKFLDEQHNDLVKSKSELLEVINKINATTKELFADTFEQVRKNFQEMFTELFGGGKANLLLVDDLDPLESGIEIIARPPGKQLQSISLLSGGERTRPRSRCCSRFIWSNQVLFACSMKWTLPRRVQHSPVYQDPGPLRPAKPVCRHHA